MLEKVHKIFFAFALIFIYTFFLAAEENKDAEDTSAQSEKLFPITLLISSAESGKVCFIPDLPPDSFFVHNKSEFKSITINNGTEYKLVKSNDVLSIFPFYYDNVFYSVKTKFGLENKIKGFTVKLDEEDINIEFLDFLPSNQPVTARINKGEEYYFVSFSYQANDIIEAFFSEDGTFLSLYRLKFLKDDYYDVVAINKKNGEGDNVATLINYDSMENITNINSGSTIYKAIYNGTKLSYSEKQDENGEKKIDFQYDNNGILVRAVINSVVNYIADEALDTETVDTVGTVETVKTVETVEYAEYKYKFDKKGNWIERQEFIAAAEENFLIPKSSNLVTRIIEY